MTSNTYDYVSGGLGSGKWYHLLSKWRGELMGRQMNSADSQGVPSGRRVGRECARQEWVRAALRSIEGSCRGPAASPGRPRKSCRETGWLAGPVPSSGELRAGAERR